MADSDGSEAVGLHLLRIIQLILALIFQFGVEPSGAAEVYSSSPRHIKTSSVLAAEPTRQRPREHTGDAARNRDPGACKDEDLVTRAYELDGLFPSVECAYPLSLSQSANETGHIGTFSALIQAR